MTESTITPPEVPKINLEAPAAIRRSAVQDALESLGITDIDNLLDVRMDPRWIELNYLARTDNGKIRLENGDAARITVRIPVTIDGQMLDLAEALRSSDHRTFQRVHLNDLVGQPEVSR